MVFTLSMHDRHFEMRQMGHQRRGMLLILHRGNTDRLCAVLTTTEMPFCAALLLYFIVSVLEVEPCSFYSWWLRISYWAKTFHFTASKRLPLQTWSGNETWVSGCISRYTMAGQLGLNKRRRCVPQTGGLHGLLLRVHHRLCLKGQIKAFMNCTVYELNQRLFHTHSRYIYFANLLDMFPPISVCSLIVHTWPTSFLFLKFWFFLCNEWMNEFVWWLNNT